MNKSETIGKLAEALAKAQGQMKAAEKDKNNPFFKSNYADLPGIWGACREPLSKNGLCVTQSLGRLEGMTVLSTLLMHTSGEWIESIAPIQPVKNDPQGLGSAITYMRRFSLGALVGVVADDADDADDDGNAASSREESKPSFTQKVVPAVIKPQPFSLSQEQMKGIEDDCKSLRLSGVQLIDICKKRFDKNSLKALSIDEYIDLNHYLKEQLAELLPSDTDDLSFLDP